MAVQSTNNDPVTLTPNAIRYALALVVSDGTRRISLTLQRAAKAEDGKWTDDPRRDSSHKIADVTFIPDEQVDALVELLRAVRQRPGLLARRAVETRDPVRYSAHLKSYIAADGSLDVEMTQLLHFTDAPKTVPLTEASVNRFLMVKANDLVPSVQTLWAALDAAVNTANADQHWL